MKKTFLLLLIAAFALSCEGPMGPQGPPGRPGIEGPPGIKWVVRDFVVKGEDWLVINDNSGKFLNYEFVFDCKELTKAVYDDGFVLPYIENENKIQYQLPEIVNREDEDGTKWFQTVKCNFNVGQIAFTVSNSDFVEDNPGTIRFRVYFAEGK